MSGLNTEGASALNAPTPQRNIKADLLSGAMVSLIALPLCLGIAGASGFPAINGVFTAIVGGILCGLLSNSELTIKGPAAGLIAIVLGAALEFASMAGVELNNMDASVFMQYLPSVAAVALVAGLIQIAFGLAKAGALADLFPSSVIHGLLASIGIIIVGKQLYPLLGLKPNTADKAYEAFLELPAHAVHFAPQVTLIGIASLAILFLYPVLKKQFAACKVMPPQLIILAISIPAAMYLYSGFEGNARSYDILVDGQSQTQFVRSLLVRVPESAAKLPAAFIYPDFRYIGTIAFWKWVLMFALVGSLESLLSAKAVDVLDPWKRRSDLNRDLLAVGIANSVVACIGGLPMISEIVRSSANKDFGARTRWANGFHGVCLLGSVLLIPQVLNYIPLSALAAMLVYAGCRLAHYKEFLHMWHIGKEQLVIFVSTILGVLMTDLLIGVGIGIFTKLAIQIFFGVRPLQFFKAPALIDTCEDRVVIYLESPAVFSNWLMIKRKIVKLPRDRAVVVNFSGSSFVDHTVMSKMEELRNEFAATGRSLLVEGLEGHRSLSKDELSAKKATKSSNARHPQVV